MTLHVKSKAGEPAKVLRDDRIFTVVDDKMLGAKHKRDPTIMDIRKDEAKIRRDLVNNGYADLDGKNLNFKIPENVLGASSRLYQDVSKKFGNNTVIEVADGSVRVRRKLHRAGNQFIEFQDLAVSKQRKDGLFLETADDDRVIGIPYTIGNIGADKYYIINGRVYSGWAMWFGLQAIRSPEDYARNVDLTYNISFVWAGFNLKSQLSLGASFDITDGMDDTETPEEAIVKEVMFNKLRINISKLRKTSFHLDMYGNAYWHVRRDVNGFPDKITILQPERLKVFLDPKTTKVLYYVYLPPVLAGMALTPYPDIRNNPSVLQGPALTYPTPIVIDPNDIIHFMENNYTEYPFGLSSCKSMIDPCTARLDINVLAPMIFKRYAKPLIHWRLDPLVPFSLTKGQIESYIGGMKDTIENMEPTSDPITTTRWSASVIGAAQGKAELLTILQDLDNQIFSCIGVPESYFKPQSGADRMISEQDKTFLAAMQERQQMVGELIDEKLVRPIVDNYDKMINMQLALTKEPLLPPRSWNSYPGIQWRETFKQDQVTTIQNTMALLQSGIIDHSRAARRVGENVPRESEELSRQLDLQQINEEVQIKQAELALYNTQVQILQAQTMLANGGMMPEPAGAGGDPGQKSPQKSRAQEATENARYRVTFTNRSGKKQTEVMRGDTLEKVRSSGQAISNVQAAEQKPQNEAQKAAKRTIS